MQSTDIIKEACRRHYPTHWDISNTKYTYKLEPVFNSCAWNATHFFKSGALFIVQRRLAEIHRRLCIINE